MVDRRIVLAGVGVAVGVGLLALMGRAPPAQASIPDPDVGVRAEWDRLLRIAGVSENWRRFFALEARKESMFTSNVFLGIPRLQPPGTILSRQADAIGEEEWMAARNLYRNSPHLHECGWGEDRYAVAGGIVGLLGPNAVKAYKGSELDCIDPWAMFDLRESVPMAYGYARLLTRSRKPSTWLEMVSAWGIPGKTKDSERLAQLRKRIPRHLDALGIPVAWLDMPIEPLPKRDLVALRALVLGAVGYAPRGDGSQADELKLGEKLLWVIDHEIEADELERLASQHGVSVVPTRLEDLSSTITHASTTSGPLVLAAAGSVSGPALLEVCRAGDCVREVYLFDPILEPGEIRIKPPVARVTSWATSARSQAVGRSLLQASRAGVDVVSSTVLWNKPSIADAWALVMQKMRTQP